MELSRKEQGFTLIEVLVALAIIAVAMAAAVRVAGLMTQSNGLLRDRSMALLSAQGRLAELRLEGRLPRGTKRLTVIRAACSCVASRASHRAPMDA
ncbi:type II secretion system protein I [Pseudomonas marginalis]|nr:type II secretion system protein I [Pseudomonas marginalis]